MGKIEILSTHNLLCRQFAAVCQKIATPRTFLAHVAAADLCHKISWQFSAKFHR